LVTGIVIQVQFGLPLRRGSQSIERILVYQKSDDGAPVEDNKYTVNIISFPSTWFLLFFE
jgi:hypothetical protein